MAWFPFVSAAELPEGLAAAFEDVDTAVRDASYRVRAELRTARFDLDVLGRPVSSEVSDAIVDATVAQLRFWAETGDDTGAGSQGGGGSILSVSLPGGSGGTDARAKQEARTAPAVFDILRGCEDIDWTVGY